MTNYHPPGYRWHLLDGYLQDRRTKLIARLGGQCVQCGGTEDLEFHHPYGKAWTSNRLSRTKRLVKYEQDYNSGNLQLLCHDCHIDPYGCHPDDCFCPHCRG